MEQGRSVPDPDETRGSSRQGRSGQGSVAARGRGGEKSAYSNAASGLSALGRARQHAIAEQAGAPPLPQGEGGTGRDGAVPFTGRKSSGPGAGGARRRPRFRRGKGGGQLHFRPRRSRRRLRHSSGGLHSPRHSRSLASIALRLLLLVVVLAVLGGVYTAVQLRRSVPQPVLQPTAGVAAIRVVPGPRPALPWPRSGQSAVALAGFGLLGSSGPARPVPLASLTKVMTALVVLHDHPLRPGQAGASLRITPADEALYRAESAVGDSVTPVAAGERLTQLELLEMLLIPSADNVAPVLSRWDAGSEAAFVARMNAAAARLGMRRTHYSDTNGLSPGTVGTALDQLRLAEAAAANPVLMSIVRQPAVTLPDGNTLRNYDTLLGRNGVIGIKTGSTTAAGGCFMLAARGVVQGRSVEVLGVVLGQHSSPLIGAALRASQALINPALAALRTFTAVPAGTTVAQVVSQWAPPVSVKTTRAISLVTVPGMTVHLAVKLTGGRWPASRTAGSTVATVTATVGGQSESVPAVTTADVPGAPLRWRLKRF